MRPVKPPGRPLPQILPPAQPPMCGCHLQDAEEGPAPQLGPVHLKAPWVQRRLEVTRDVWRRGVCVTSRGRKGVRFPFIRFPGRLVTYNLWFKPGCDACEKLVLFVWDSPEIHMTKPQRGCFPPPFTWAKALKPLLLSRAQEIAQGVPPETKATWVLLLE